LRYKALLFSFLATKLLYNANDENIEVAEKLLRIFEISYVKLYGAFNCTLTYHLLTKHLISDVRKHGSLVGHSAYSLEGTQGLLLKALSGTRSFSNQMIRCTFNFF
jgi:hypothetical protein